MPAAALFASLWRRFFWHTYIGCSQLTLHDGTQYIRWECEDRGKLRYTKNGEEISEAEFNAAWNS